MKIKSLVLAISFLLLLWFVFPLLFIILNQWLGLPVYIFGMFRLIGIILVVSGLIIALIASLTFIKVGTGTPVIIEPPKKLVIKGLYQKTRNPIYLAHLMIFLGLFIFLGHLMLLIYVIIGAIGFNLYIIKHEELILKQRFGHDYIDYTKSVPRWI